MNWKEYIESGMLELYVAGVLPEEDMSKIRALELENPAIAQEILRIEADLIALAEQNTSAPDFRILEAALSEISETPIAKKQLAERRGVVPINILWLSIAASLLLLMVAGVMLYSQRTTIQELTASNSIAANRIDTLQTTIAKTKTDYEALIAAMEGTLQFTEDLKSHFENSGTRRVIMSGQGNNPDAKATVFWNSATHKVYLEPGTLPEPDSSHQYQLWALVDGQPIDAGVFDAKDSTRFLKDIERADAFAVTLEPLGGSQNPTLEKLFVLGMLGS